MDKKDIFNATMGFVWLQPDGPNTELLPLGCIDVADIAQPQGDVATRYCRTAVSHPNKWEVADRTQGPPGDVTTSLTVYVKKTASYLQAYRGCGALYVNQGSRGRKDIFVNYESGNLLYDALITNKTKSNLASRENRDASEQSFDVTAAPPLSEFWKLVVTPLVTAETGDLLDIALAGQDLCWGLCGPSSERCDDLIAAAANDGAATANLQITHDGGNVWAKGAHDPFGVSLAMGSVVAFPISGNVVRYLAGRGTTVAGSPVGVAYSDDDGATWSAVVTMGVNGEFFVGGGSLWAIDHRNIWGVTNLGGIYKSTDGGISWTEQVTANVISLNYVHFADEQNGLVVGDTNVIYFSGDGGAHWALVTGPAGKAADDILSCRCLDRYRWWIGFDDGELHFTNDGGVTWEQRVLQLPGGGATCLDEITDIDFYDYYHGVLAANWTGTGAANRASVYRTVNGGFSWEVYNIPDTFDATTRLTAILMCDANKVYTSGGLVAAVGSVYELTAL